MTTAELLDNIGKKAKQHLVNNITKVDYSGFGPANNTGKLANSVRYEATNNKVTLYAESYVFNVSEGRKAGKYPPYNPNSTRYGVKVKGINKGKPRGSFEPIGDWLDTKQSARSRFNWDSKTNSEKAGTEFMVARKIAEKGTVIAQKGGSEMLNSVINEAFTNAIKSEISGILAFEFNSILSGKP